MRLSDRWRLDARCHALIAIASGTSGSISFVHGVRPFTRFAASVYVAPLALYGSPEYSEPPRWTPSGSNIFSRINTSAVPFAIRRRETTGADLPNRRSVNHEESGRQVRVTLFGEPYDGPFINWSKAVAEKYGPAGEERGDLVWNGSNGKARLTKTRDGGAMLLFQGKRWQQDIETFKQNVEKGQKF